MGSLYDTIAGLCAERKITAYKLCTELGMRNSVISDLKTGQKKGLNAETLSKIADYFGVTTDFLLGKAPQQPKPPAQAEDGFDDFTYALFGEASELTEENKAMLLDMARMLRKRQQEGK